MNTDMNSRTIESIANCVIAHPSLESAWDVIANDEASDHNQKMAGIKLAIDRGFATQAEWDAITA